MTQSTGAIRIGISGWQYDGWRGHFYPSELARGDELAYALRRFPTVEVNGTFYSLKRKSDFEAWLEAAPAPPTDEPDGPGGSGESSGSAASECGAGGPVFALKGSRYITHMKRLRGPEPGLANFFGQGLLVLGEALGPILWQLRDDFAFDRERVAPFLEALPATYEEAARLARRHDDVVEEAATEPRASGPIRHALEARHESFAEPESVALLREHGVALVVSDNPGEFPVLEADTADFAYVRLHGPETLYHGSYSDEALDAWAERIGGWSGGEPIGAGRAPHSAVESGGGSDGSGASGGSDAPRDVYVYFDNDADGAAPFDARRLMERLDRASGFAAPGTKDAMPG
jgi:uncharacterized protein YecE (DUF72 family)